MEVFESLGVLTGGLLGAHWMEVFGYFRVFQGYQTNRNYREVINENIIQEQNSPNEALQKSTEYNDGFGYIKAANHIDILVISSIMEIVIFFVFAKIQNVNKITQNTKNKEESKINKGTLCGILVAIVQLCLPFFNDSVGDEWMRICIILIPMTILFYKKLCKKSNNNFNNTFNLILVSLSAFFAFFVLTKPVFVKSLNLMEISMIFLFIFAGTYIFNSLPQCFEDSNSLPQFMIAKSTIIVTLSLINEGYTSAIIFSYENPDFLLHCLVLSLVSVTTWTLISLSSNSFTRISLKIYHGLILGYILSHVSLSFDFSLPFVSSSSSSSIGKVTPFDKTLTNSFDKSFENSIPNETEGFSWVRLLEILAICFVVMTTLKLSLCKNENPSAPQGYGHIGQNKTPHQEGSREEGDPTGEEPRGEGQGEEEERDCYVTEEAMKEMEEFEKKSELN